MEKEADRYIGVIDPVYEKYADAIDEHLIGDEFYRYFLENLKASDRSIQFSNRKLEKKIDESWLVAVENCMTPFNNIIMNPRNFIIEDEEIVNVAVARQSTPEVLRHLTTHGQYIDEITEDNVRPNHLLNKFKEDTWNTYENRFVYTLLEKTTDFVAQRYNAIFGSIQGEFGAFMKVNTEVVNDSDTVSVSLDIRIRQSDSDLADDEESQDLFRRLKQINEQLTNYNKSLFAKTMKKYARVKNPIVKTNAIQKNPNFKACYLLWVFLYAYRDVGYEINVYEQSNEIKPIFETDINNDIFINYLILKNYLEGPGDRDIDFKREDVRKRVLKPRIIKKIVEELVKNFDITDTEVRKVLIEEVTRAQLEQMEENDRRKLFENTQRQKAEQRRRVAEEKKKVQEQMQKERAERLRQLEREVNAKQKEEEKYHRMIRRVFAACQEEIRRFEKENASLLGDSQPLAVTEGDNKE